MLHPQAESRAKPDGEDRVYGESTPATLGLLKSGSKMNFCEKVDLFQDLSKKHFYGCWSSERDISYTYTGYVLFEAP